RAFVAGALQFLEARVGRRRHDAVPQPARFFTLGCGGDHGAEERGAVERHHGGADFLAHLGDALGVRGAQGVIGLVAVLVTDQVGGQAHLRQRLHEHLMPLGTAASGVEAGADGVIQRLDPLFAVQFAGGVDHPHRSPRLLQHGPVPRVEVRFVLIEHRQAHDVPAHGDVAHLLHFSDPAGSHPGPRAGRVEPEIGDIGGGGIDRPLASFLRGLVLHSHCAAPSQLEVASPPRQPAAAAQHSHPRTWEDRPRPTGRYRSEGVHQMPGENLTRIEARERAQLVSPSHYDVALDLTGGPDTFISRTTVRFTAQPGAATFIDLIAPAVHEVVLNGRSLPVAEVFADSRIQLTDLQAQNELTVVADCAYMNTGEGLHRFVDPVDEEVYLYSQFEVADTRRMFAVFEQPDLKAAFSFTVTAPESWQVVSNSPTPAPKQAGEGTSTWAFEPTPVLPCYVTALVAGPYHRVTGELTSSDGRTIPLGVFCRASLAEYLDAENIMDITRAGFEFYERAFDMPYPFA